MRSSVCFRPRRLASRSVERLRLKAALHEKAEERKLAAIQRFSQAAFAWSEYLTFIREAAGLTDETARENDLRSKERQQAYRYLVLLAPRICTSGSLTVTTLWRESSGRNTSR